LARILLGFFWEKKINLQLRKKLPLQLFQSHDNTFSWKRLMRLELGLFTVLNIGCLARYPTRNESFAEFSVGNPSIFRNHIEAGLKLLEGETEITTDPLYVTIRLSHVFCDLLLMIDVGFDIEKEPVEICQCLQILARIFGVNLPRFANLVEFSDIGYRLCVEGQVGIRSSFKKNETSRAFTGRRFQSNSIDRYFVADLKTKSVSNRTMSFSPMPVLY
jgi:hypothetical protein